METFWCSCFIEQDCPTQSQEILNPAGILSVSVNSPWKQLSWTDLIYSNISQSCLYFIQYQHGHRGRPHSLSQSASSSRALILLGNAGLGYLHRRYRLILQLRSVCYSFSSPSWTFFAISVHVLLGFVLIRQVTLHTFGLVQSKFFPVYFYCVMGSSVINLALYAVYHPRELLDAHECVQVRH